MKNVYLYLLFLTTLAVTAQVDNLSLNFNADQTGLINFGPINELDNASQFTFEAWVKVDEWKQNSILFAKRLDAQNKIGIQLGNGTNGQLFFMVAKGGNAYLSANTALNDNNWHHVALVYDGNQAVANNRITAYVDGVSISNFYTGTLPTTTPNTTANFELGNNFVGELDEIRVWDIPLSQAQLDYKNTISTSHELYANLLNYWKLDKAAPNTVYDVKGTTNGLITGHASKVIVTDNINFKYRIVNAYVRKNLYDLGHITNQFLQNCNDIIVISGAPYADGEIWYEWPDAQGTTINASYLASKSGRTGLIDFGGAGASMNVGGDMLNTTTGGINQFSFSTWVYIDNWTENSYLFKQEASATSKVNLKLGAAATNRLYLEIADGTDNYAYVDNSGLASGAWHNVAVAYKGNAAAGSQVNIYIDGVLQTEQYKNGNNLLPTKLPFIRNDIELGVDLDGSFDETSFSALRNTQSIVNSLMNNELIVDTFNETKIRSYWKFDDASNVGADQISWKATMLKIQSVFTDLEGVAFKFGFGRGDFQNMLSSATTRNNFATNVSTLLANNTFLDGFDLDFEWCLTNTCWSNFNEVITALDAILVSDKHMTVTLHSLFHNLSASSIAKVQFFGMQSYGPRASTMSYPRYVSDLVDYRAQGFPDNKIVMGVPFYTASSNNSKVTDKYRNLIAANPGIDGSVDQAILNGILVTFNGTETIKQKTRLVVDEDLAGTMFWSSGTDMQDYSHDRSLLRALNQITNANVEMPITEDDGTLSTNGISFIENQAWLKVFPNPAKKDIHISFNSFETGQLLIYNLSGQLVYEHELNGKKDFRLNIVNLNRGFYIVKFISKTTHKNYLNKIILN